MTNSTVEISYPELKGLFTDILAKLSKEDLRDFYEEVGAMLAVDKVTLSRDEIVALAKGDISLIEEQLSKTGVSVEFVVNSEKRTVVALVKFNSTGYIRSRGIAKCDPNDCFNEYIGKAIALRRAFGNPPMYEYLNAPQPEGKQIGDIVSYEGKSYRLIEVSWRDVHLGNAELGSIISDCGKIIDDSARYR
ncbi:hypothetical protein [Oceanobacillus sojae]|uniref:hypothetical protein n=1 Tax=Oceanobacillus sojae TaxID=582851 RepID=UPI00362B6F20